MLDKSKLEWFNLAENKLPPRLHPLRKIEKRTHYPEL
jgi:hypothetical protein